MAAERLAQEIQREGSDKRAGFAGCAVGERAGHDGSEGASGRREEEEDVVSLGSLISKENRVPLPLVYF